MGVIVAAPTAGSCGAMPGAVLAVADAIGADEETTLRALLIAGLIGVYIARDATFAAEEGGCMAECGSGSAMAAAALVFMAEGNEQQLESGVDGTAEQPWHDLRPGRQPRRGALPGRNIRRRPTPSPAPTWRSEAATAPRAARRGDRRLTWATRSPTTCPANFAAPPLADFRSRRPPSDRRRVGGWWLRGMSQRRHPGQSERSEAPIPTQ